MRVVSGVIAAGLIAGAALAQTSAETPAETGARPGNAVGTGQSLPLGDKASNIGPGDSASTIAPNLPSPEVGPGAGPGQLLRAARGALAAGRTGEAQQALEMAETRALDRSVPFMRTGAPSDNPLVGGIRQALQALGHGDRAGALGFIDQVLPLADQAG